MAILDTIRNLQSPLVDEGRFSAAMCEVFRRSGVIYGSLSYERADGHYMDGPRSARVPSDLASMGLQLTERNRNPGLLLAKNRHTPIAISVEDPKIAAYPDVQAFAKALDEEGFLKVYYLPIRDLNGKLFVTGITSRRRKLTEFEVRLIHSYCLEAAENVVMEMQPGPNDKSILTSRERECLVSAARGFTEKETGKKLSISHFTVRAHLQNSKSKLGANSKIEAIMKGLKLGEILPADIGID